jgi:hypothetical protein
MTSREDSCEAKLSYRVIRARAVKRCGWMQVTTRSSVAAVLMRLTGSNSPTRKSRRGRRLFHNTVTGEIVAARLQTCSSVGAKLEPAAVGPSPPLEHDDFFESSSRSILLG